MGEASGQYCGPSLEGRVNIPRAQCTLTPHRLLVRVNFVYKVPFVGEGGESPQLCPETGEGPTGMTLFWKV